MFHNCLHLAGKAVKLPHVNMHSMNCNFFSMDNKLFNVLLFVAKTLSYVHMQILTQIKLLREIFSAKGVTTSPDVISFSAGGLFDYVIVNHDAYFNSCLKHVCLSPKLSFSHIQFLIKGWYFSHHFKFSRSVRKDKPFLIVHPWTCPHWRLLLFVTDPLCCQPVSEVTMSRKELKKKLTMKSKYWSVKKIRAWLVMRCGKR